jgi:hypothetical protein
MDVCCGGSATRWSMAGDVLLMQEGLSSKMVAAGDMELVVRPDLVILFAVL